MSDKPSLTEYIQQVVDKSMTTAIQRVAGRTPRVADRSLDSAEEATLAGKGRVAMRMLAAGRQLAAGAVLSIAFLLAGAFLFSGSSVVDADRHADWQIPVAAAKKRVALVIGNSAYIHTPRLANPGNDANDISAGLRRLGFQVIEGFDLDKAAFDKKIREFAAALPGADVAVFFYAGHGLEVMGYNYLVPVDAQLQAVSALDLELVRLDLVHRTMEREARTNILFFDACRNNPLARNLARAMGARSIEIGRGLTAVESGAGTLISFSTQPGKIALDGKGRNSPFAGALKKQLGRPNDDLAAILIAVRNDVMKETEGKQVPWEHSALIERFYFDAAAQAQASVALPAKRSRFGEAALAWRATRDTTDMDVLGAFIATYRHTFFAELARARVDELTRQATATVFPAPAAHAASSISD